MQAAGPIGGTRIYSPGWNTLRERQKHRLQCIPASSFSFSTAAMNFFFCPRQRINAARRALARFAFDFFGELTDPPFAPRHDRQGVGRLWMGQVSLTTNSPQRFHPYMCQWFRQHFSRVSRTAVMEQRLGQRWLRPDTSAIRHSTDRLSKLLAAQPHLENCRRERAKFLLRRLQQFPQPSRPKNSFVPFPCA